MSLPSPYKAKNASFDTLEELLLVKGMTPEILYGGGGNKGAIAFLTVTSKRNAINVNTALKEVLMAVPDITSEIADGIISYRENKRITNLQEVGIPPQSMQYLSMTEGNTYAIEAVGYKTDERKGHTTKAVVAIEGNNKYKYLYYKSPANISR
jgi:general secretion pathway protein K